MAKTVIDINEEALALAAQALGTKTKKDTVNAALEEIGARVRRERALAKLIKLDEEGAFDKGREPGFKEEVRKTWKTQEVLAS
ncbi:type II toxin-antitoxin system VapB family antitoxin [Streptomyces sp. A3M-1-3]|uniref:type II toxin-antitoxin system VapB family antitoxin n=1 Tax=Streptomyces sp. A3M-1-3 TaxID=2962044 RepID=UPI0020B72A57|nr:type II toxin-antitoxin system VapB family antitoxin [Streptomyces sp. A3M-1-3]MCP3817711.1 type II toxin-antitoxin system VapB family antitoxin [Streptomyces sp. A3M-1-3]